MNAPARITADPQAIALSPSWPLRWQAVKGTGLENAVLMSIAAQAQGKDDEMFAAAFDAATVADPDERAEFICDVERIFIEYAAEEAAEARAYDWEVRHGRDVPDWMVDQWMDDYAARPAETYVPGAQA